MELSLRCKSVLIAAVAVFAFGSMGICQGRTIYVDSDAGGANDGSNWANAYNFLQDALADANSGHNISEIWVAQGIYRPDETSTDPNGSGDREATFQLINGVALRGGFAGYSGPDPNIRDIDLYETVLSGDIEDNDEENIMVQDLLDDPTRAENSFHVVSAVTSDLSLTTVLDGVTITAGNANLPVIPSENWPHFYGGGIYCTGWASPTIINCNITGNSANLNGGGMYSWSTSPVVTGCTFAKNLADNGAGLGQGERHPSHCEPIVSNCIFIDNVALFGAAMILHNRTNAIISNSLIVGNTTEYFGVIACDSYSNPKIINCTITDNSGVAAVGSDYYSSIEITNCIIWANQTTYQLIVGSETIASVNYSDVQGGQDDVYVHTVSVLDWGKGNIDADPCFVDLGSYDYYLLPNSPCIDAGDPNYVSESNDLDLSSYPRVVDGDCNDTDVVDMGAYEFSYAYMGDLDNDCRVNMIDFAILGEAWMSEAGDLNWDAGCDISEPEDEVIDGLDLGVFVGNWLCN